MLCATGIAESTRVGISRTYTPRTRENAPDLYRRQGRRVLSAERSQAPPGAREPFLRRSAQRQPPYCGAESTHRSASANSAWASDGFVTRAHSMPTPSRSRIGLRPQTPGGLSAWRATPGLRPRTNVTARWHRRGRSTPGTACGSRARRLAMPCMPLAPALDQSWGNCRVSETFMRTRRTRPGMEGIHLLSRDLPPKSRCQHCGRCSFSLVDNGFPVETVDTMR